MTFGVTETGFNPKRYTDIEQEVFDYWRQELSIEINTETGSLFDQIGQPLFDQIEQVWAGMHDLALSWSPFDSSGMSLDYIVAYTGIVRKEAAPTVGAFLVDGDDATNVTTDFRVIANNNVQYRPIADFSISKNNIFYANFEIDKQNDPNTFYEVTINGTLASWEDTSGTASKSDIVTNLVSIINANQSTYQVEASPHPADPEILVFQNIDDTLTINSVDDTTNTKYLFQFDFRSIKNGAFQLPEKSIVSIQTPITGINAVQNYAAGFTGNDVETDAELLARWQQSFIKSGAVLAAIVAAVLNDVDDVTSADGLENITDVTDSNGLRPHSILIIVSGGDEDEIAQKIWDVKGGGIRTEGDITKDVIDFKGRTKQCSFSRPTTKYMHLRIRLTLNPEETFVPGTEESIRNDCVAHAIKIQGIGDDSISQKYTEKVFKYSGIRIADIKVALTDNEGDSPSGFDTWKAIAAFEVAYLSYANCTVEVV